MPGLTIDDAESFLPRYLNPEKKKQLFSEINAFLATGKLLYYGEVDDPEPLQGDGWAAVPFFDSAEDQVRTTNVAVVSNSCDVTVENKRRVLPAILVAPIVSLAKYQALLEKHNTAQVTIDVTISQIRRQEITNLFYFPRGMALKEDSVLFLDRISHVSSIKFPRGESSIRLCRLSQQGFWLFLVKLAIHFCRSQEAIERR